MGLNDPVANLTELSAVTGGVRVFIQMLTRTALDAHVSPDQLAEMLLCFGITGPQDRLKLTIVEDDSPVTLTIDSVQLRHALDH